MNGLLNTVPTAALTQSQTLVELGLVVVLAAAAPLIGQILRLPSILVLLALGFGAGAAGALDPNALRRRRRRPDGPARRSGAHRPAGLTVSHPEKPNIVQRLSDDLG